MKALVLLAFACFVQVPSISAQSALDTQAWNYTWDRFEDVLKGSRHGQLAQDEIVNILKFPTPLAGGSVAFASAIQLQHIAGVIPKRYFTLDPSDQDIRLHNVYRTILMSLKAPDVTDAQQAKIDAAAAKYDKAYEDFDTARQKWSGRIDTEMERIKKRGQTPTDDDYLRIRDATSGTIAAKKSALDSALNKWQNLLPSSWALTAALQALKDATGGIDDVSSNGIWRYELGEKVNFDSDSCTADGTGWYELALSHDVKSQATRVENWNANGAWSGTFVKIGVDGSKGDFSNTVTTDNESIKLRFCNIRFIPVSAPWLSMDVLRDIDRGQYLQKPDTLIVGKVLGPKGMIPRIVKGLIVARDIRFEAKLDKGLISEVKKSFSLGGGFSIGPFSFGGSGNRTEYNITQSNDSGFFGLSSNYGRPIVLAIVLEDTKSPQ
jgi:hypothetical protein